MDYSDFTREQLVQLIEELHAFNLVLMREKRQETGQSGSDCLGHWYWNTKTDAIVFNAYHPISLGYDRSEIPEKISVPFLKKLLHPEDYLKTIDTMKRYLNGNVAIYDAEYRLRTKEGEYRWFYDRGRVTLQDSDGSPLILEGIVFDITEKKKPQLEIEDQNKVLAEMSYVDGLTKVSNHRAVVDQLSSAMSDAGRLNQPLSITLFDIDDFKTVNDSHGHIYGDQVLTDVASILRSSIRDTDIVGRYGGDEFLVIFTNADKRVAYQISERIREAVEQGSYVNGIKITVSGGLKQFGGETLLDFINAADTNLYEAKKRGKNLIACSSIWINSQKP